MPLYDCMLLFKPNVRQTAIINLISTLGNHVYRKNGVLTDVTSFGVVQLGYGIKKLDGRYYQGQLMQMTMMTPPSFNSELYYLNKEDRLLRWLLVKHRDMKFEDDLFTDYDADNESVFKSRLYRGDEDDDDDDDNDTEDEEKQEENDYQVPQAKNYDALGLRF